jgi:bifunctional non-homologous end joining protein LigD
LVPALQKPAQQHGPLRDRNPHAGLDGEDFRKNPLGERRKRLESLSSGNDALRVSSHVDGARGAALFRRACAMGLEGLVSKQVDTPDRSGLFWG